MPDKPFRDTWLGRRLRGAGIFITACTVIYLIGMINPLRCEGSPMTVSPEVGYARSVLTEDLATKTGIPEANISPPPQTHQESLSEEVIETVSAHFVNQMAWLSRPREPDRTEEEPVFDASWRETLVSSARRKLPGKSAHSRMPGLKPVLVPKKEAD